MCDLDDIDFPFGLPDTMDLVDREKNKIEEVKQELKNREMLKSFINKYNQESQIYKIDVETLTYDHCIDIYWNGQRKIVKWSEEGTNYRKAITKELYRQNIPKIPQNIKYFHLYLDIFISYSQRDTDNVSKPIIDTLFNYYDKDDNIVKRFTSTTKKCDKGEECFLFKIEGFNEIDFENSELLSKYIKSNRRKI